MVNQDWFVKSLQLYARDNRTFGVFLKKFNLHKLNELQYQVIYKELAQYILNPKWTEQIASLFCKVLVNILSLAIDFNKAEVVTDNADENVRNAVALAKLLLLHSDSEGFVVKYFATFPSPFTNFATKAPSKKLKKVEDNYKPSKLDIVKSCFTFLQKKPDFFKNKWDWSTFFNTYSNDTNPEIRWLAAHCLGIYLGLNEKQLDEYMKSMLTTDEIIQCDIASLKSSQRSYHIQDESSNDYHYTSPNVVDIGGILLPSTGASNPTPVNSIELVPVESTTKNLHKLALGIATKKPINLLGPVGSGKTTLIEYLAVKTGRKLGEDFIKIQLGDQTDSKMLLGTYRCTDIPGEFVWQPGVLTQAVLEGSWLLLEDIDSASMDIASVISGLIENQYLTVPGFRDFIEIAPGFQLFMTQRLLNTMSGYHKKYSASTSLLEKHVLNINIEPLSYKELETIISTQYKCLTTIASRMVSVFKVFVEREKHSRNSRLASTRDLFKWCSRSVIDFNVASQQSALRVLQNAIDVFCCASSSSEERLALAMDISAHLGIVAEKAKYFCERHQPILQITESKFVVGAGSLPRVETEGLQYDTNFCFTRTSSSLLERIMCCVNMKESVLLVGETGTGKTSTVQFIANTIGQKMIVINMNQQSDSADLLGGYKPVDMKIIIGPIKKEFEDLFCSYFNAVKNQKFLCNLNRCYNEKLWMMLVKLMKRSYEAAISRLQHISEMAQNRKRKLEDPQIQDIDTYNKWTAIGAKIIKLEAQLKHKSALAFAFIEGSLIKAIKCGYWVLLDEINLANAETLECLSGLLEGSDGTISLLEKGDKTPIKRHPNFMLFACMNPSTDVGKKDLPTGLRNRFTEFFVDELTDKNDLIKMINKYFEALHLKNENMENIANFYLHVRKEAIVSLSDGLGHKPHFSLRSLCRALVIAKKNPCGVFKRSLYEAFCLSFLTQLDSASYKKVESLIAKYLIPEKGHKLLLKDAITEPKTKGKYIKFEGYWIEQGPLETYTMSDYILTDSVRANLKDLVRIVSIGRLPVLLQGDTSVGKTSLITYLAKASGYKCVRINNHEHTDLQEYIGSYAAAEDGKLEFREGILVDAMRNGHWIILDELNLAPSDVLEALNRVLDDNRELFIPEVQQVVKAHPNFMLFATQNPPGAYGGRKMLSRAFRNRFVELHFNEIPHNELEHILHKRCEMPETYARKMINVMKDLQMRRRGSAAFAGKHGFITLRDLFRWGERYRRAADATGYYDWDQHLADEGYLLLAGRVRKAEEKEQIALVLKKHMKRDVNSQHLFTLSDRTSSVTKPILEKIMATKDLHANIVWTYSMRQLGVLVCKSLAFNEPVLLVGETGGGKTTVCNIIAQNNGQELVTINCHMHTESSDFIGALRPVRDHSGEEAKLFEWVYGPLVQAMQDGNLFLADEISLADDSVLERLNSLLEPERTLLIAEKGSDSNELIQAHKNFHFIGTMNPGGDFGKKELSPALRNRFTEIWCETCSQRQDLIDIIEHNLQSNLNLDSNLTQNSIGVNIMDFIEWFRDQDVGKRFTISIRDILTWVNFINICTKDIGVSRAYFHGVCLTFLDSLGSGVTSMESMASLKKFEHDCMDFIKNQMNIDEESKDLCIDVLNERFGILPFYVECGEADHSKLSFNFEAPTTIKNAMRVLRGLQLKKALLLEGSPGVGKTSLVTALAKASRNKLFRINLSDQTDISDLFGADLPVEGGNAGEFAWRDGPLLQALRQGHWILLDELNLASQSVLEGLNACLDHRGEIFIPELGKTFHVKPGTRFFGCQNPLKQGGSRRGLPQSFLNRFTQVYIAPLLEEDLFYILDKQFPNLSSPILNKMVEFNAKLNTQLDRRVFGHRGSPWEFNLRDMVRWCEATIFHAQVNNLNEYKPGNLIELIFVDRMRTAEDKIIMRDLFTQVFETEIGGLAPVCFVTKDTVILGDVTLERSVNDLNSSVLKQDETCLVLRNQLHVLRSLAYCVNMNWMSILVGPASCGKSSVVKTLAKLTGRNLRTLAVTSAMDITDILGGFEQADYTRHLDELSKDFERLLLRIIQKLYLIADGGGGNSNEEIALQCMRMLEKFIAIFRNGTQSSTMSEQTTLFIGKLEHLDSILNILINIGSTVLADFHPELAILRQRAHEISTQVEREGNLNAGGKFEWVDSVLIKCLKEGSWLLVDNVNLCSPAVLDRLNALLEPNGILIVGERGVDADGKMISVRPHPNFRLFLTMDPKNGDISRAMRNRGVEIFMLEECSENASALDVKSLIAKEGLTNDALINVLITLHEFIGSIGLGDKPNISYLLHSAFLIAQQLQRGSSTREAFKTAILDVYLETKTSSEFNTAEEPKAVILSKIEELLCQMAINKTDTQSFNQVTLQTKDLESKSQLALIQQQATLLLEHSAASQLCQNKQAADSDNYMDLIEYALIHFFTMTTPEDLQFRLSYFRSMCQPYLQDADSYNFPKCLKIFFENVKLNDDQLRCHLPLDERWLPDTKYPNSDTSRCNKIFLRLYYAVYRAVFETDNFETYKKRDKSSGRGRGKNSGFTLLEYLVSVRRKEVDIKIDDPVLKHVLGVCDRYDQFVQDLLNLNGLQISNTQAISFISLIEPRFQLYQYLRLKLETVDEVPDYIVNVHVHYKWFVKHAIKGLVQLLVENNPSVVMDADLARDVDSINSQLTNHFNTLKKLGKRYQKVLIGKPPLVNSVQLDLVPKINALLDTYDICNKKLNSSTTICALKANRKSLIELKKQLTFDFVNEINYKGVADAIEEEVASLENEELQVCTVFDYYSLLQTFHVRNNLSAQMDYLNTAVTIPVKLSSALQQFKDSQDNRFMHEIIIELHHYMQNSGALDLRFIRKSYGVNEEAEQICKLDLHTPILTNLISEIFLDDTSHNCISNSPFGKYREILDMTSNINTTLWSNMKSISNEKFDFIMSEKTYLQGSFASFLIEFANSLDIDSSERHHEKIYENCLEALKMFNTNSASLGEDTGIQMLASLLTLLNEKLKLLKENRKENEDINNIADSYILLNYMRLVLNSKLPSIDPLSKVTMKKRACDRERNQFDRLRENYELYNAIFSGNKDSLHPLHPLTVEKYHELSENYAELNKYVAARPVETEYQKLVKMVYHGFTTILSPGKVLSTYKVLNEIMLNLIKLNKQAGFAESGHDSSQDLESYNRELKLATTTLTSYDNFVDEITPYKYVYPDVVEPLLSNLMAFISGFQLKTSLLDKLIKMYLLKQQGVNIEEVLLAFVKFPILSNERKSHIEIVTKTLEEKMYKFITYSLQQTENVDASKHTFELLKSSIIDVSNICKLNIKYTHNFDGELFAHFNALVEQFVDAWKKQQIDTETKKRDEESLYKMRTKCDDKSPEELADIEFKRIFPSYHDEDFSDLLITELTDDPEEVIHTDEYAGNIKEEDIEFVSQLHTEYMLSFTKTEWLLPRIKGANLNCDYITPLKQKFKLFKILLKQNVHCMSYKFDRELLGTFSIILGITHNFGDSINDYNKPLKKYNFYKDSNVEEVKCSFNLLRDLEARINELLDQWPDHPTLKTIITIINRVFAFNISSPLPRFLTGLDILLTKCYEWEENAHSGVSIALHFSAISHQMIAWRKLEMANWKSSLDNVYEKVVNSTYKFWFYLYDVMREFIYEKLFTPTELISSLQNFIQQSSIAEFSVRLRLLHAFHCHATYLETSLERDMFVSILWNLYKHYEQFLPNITKQMNNLRAPIEKKLKDYVKIVRWRDITYWALKETMEKTHKIIHKYMREFEGVLKEPAQKYLVNFTSSFENVPANANITENVYKSKIDNFYEINLENYITKYEVKPIEGIGSKILKNASIYSKKMQNISLNIYKLTNYKSTLKDLDYFIGQVIATSKHLQELEVDKSLVKEKQVSQAKGHLRQKERALSDLFKALTKIGLSYRKGIIENNQKNADLEYLIKPLNIKAMLAHIKNNPNDKDLLKVSDSVEIYYRKAFMRLEILENLLKNPAKDLGLRNIERCKGYSLHLMNLSSLQKMNLIKTTNELYTLRYMQTLLEHICGNSRFASVFKLDALKASLIDTVHTITELKIIMSTTPDNNFVSDEITVPQLETDDFIKNKSDSRWIQINKLLDSTMLTVEKVLESFSNIQNPLCAPLINTNIQIRLQYLAIPNNYTSEIQIIIESLSAVSQIFGDIEMASSIKYIIDQITKDYTSLMSEEIVNKPVCKSIDIFKRDIKKIVEATLISIENIAEKYTKSSTSINVEENQTEALRENLLTTLAIENLFEELKCLDISNIIKRLNTALSIACNTNMTNLKEYRDSLEIIKPFIDQVINVFQYFVTMQVNAFRVTCKMTSVLTNIFIDLASNGFCVPPELEAEVKEGEAKMTGGMGLGDGEGERDVSDKIESEDQLDDAQPAGQEKEKDDDKDCKEEDKGIEMSEDFDSKLQDVDKKPDDTDEDNSDDDKNSDADEQMGDADDGENINKQIWGSDDEEDAKDNEENKKEEKGQSGEDEGAQEMTANDEQVTGPEEENTKQEKEQNQKEINELEEPEIDDNQVDPYHGNQPELPEPEPLDLPDDLQMDEEGENDEEPEENPFDIDTMKEQHLPEDESKESVSEDSKDDLDEKKGDNSASEDEDENAEEKTNNPDVEMEDNEKTEDGDADNKETVKDTENDDEDQNMNNEETTFDQTQSNDTTAQAMDANEATAADNVRLNENEHQKSDPTSDDTCQEDNPDKEGVGQSQMEQSKTGHKGQANAQQNIQNNKKESDAKKRNRPGETDAERSLGDNSEPINKKMKAIDSKNKDQDDSTKENEVEQDADMYKHVKEAKQSSAQIMDAVTKDQAEVLREQQLPSNDDEAEEDATESQEDIIEIEDDIQDADAIKEQTAEKVDDSMKQKLNENKSKGDIMQETADMNVDGEIVPTYSVPRGTETTYNTQYHTDIFMKPLSIDDINKIRNDVEIQLSKWHSEPNNIEAEQAWEKISSLTSTLAQELSEQLRLVLEPTQASRLKGDFRTGKRINMRKVIPYIASQFRKDKIWLRRTKPSKREYQIVLAIDDSSSMADNHSKELAFESVALISKALTLLESGQLSILSFGEGTEVIHKLTDTFTEKSGSKLLQQFKFDQQKTCVAKLVDFATEMLNSSHSLTESLLAKLLIIVSDGRGIFSEGESYVQQAVRRAKLDNIFMIFVIIDNPENKSSVLDIRKPIFKDGKIAGIKSYMDTFPFPFYIILRDINSLPTVLSDALRQWFEIVSNGDRI